MLVGERRNERSRARVLDDGVAHGRDSGTRTRAVCVRDTCDRGRDGRAPYVTPGSGSSVGGGTSSTARAAAFEIASNSAVLRRQGRGAELLAERRQANRAAHGRAAAGLLQRLGDLGLSLEHLVRADLGDRVAREPDQAEAEEVREVDGHALDHQAAGVLADHVEAGSDDVGADAERPPVAHVDGGLRALRGQQAQDARLVGMELGEDVGERRVPVDLVDLDVERELEQVLPAVAKRLVVVVRRVALRLGDVRVLFADAQELPRRLRRISRCASSTSATADSLRGRRLGEPLRRAVGRLGGPDAGSPPRADGEAGQAGRHVAVDQARGAVARVGIGPACVDLRRRRP